MGWASRARRVFCAICVPMLAQLHLTRWLCRVSDKSLGQVCRLDRASWQSRALPLREAIHKHEGQLVRIRILCQGAQVIFFVAAYPDLGLEVIAVTALNLEVDVNLRLRAPALRSDQGRSPDTAATWSLSGACRLTNSVCTLHNQCRKSCKVGGSHSAAVASLHFARSGLVNAGATASL